MTIVKTMLTDGRPGPRKWSGGGRDAMRLWRSASPATGTPGHHYLTGAWVWAPVGREDSPELPGTVRWLVPGAPGLKSHERGGALLVAWHRLGGSDLCAITFIGLDVRGQALRIAADEDRETIGNRDGCVFQARTRAPEEGVHVVGTGWRAALALTLAPWAPSGSIVAAPDRESAAAVARTIAESGVPVVLHVRSGLLPSTAGKLQGVHVAPYHTAEGPADELEEWLQARAAVAEFEGGASPASATRIAWQDLLEARLERAESRAQAR